MPYRETVSTSEPFVIVGTIVSFYTPFKDIIIDKLGQLGKYHFSFVHAEEIAHRKPKIKFKSPSSKNHSKRKYMKTFKERLTIYTQRY